ILCGLPPRRCLMRMALAAALLVACVPSLALAQEAPGAAPAPGPAPDDEVIALRAGKVLTMNARDEVIDHAVVLIRAGKIVAVGPAGSVAVPEGAREVDA